MIPHKPITAAFALIVGVLSSTATQAQTYPDRTIKFIVPYAAGGITDAQARIAAHALTTELNQQIIIENKPGASGAIGIDQLKKSPPDGYTFLVFATSQAAVVPFISKTQFMPGKDYEPVSNLALNAQALVIGAKIPANTVAEFAAWAKTEKALNYASPGIGTTTNLSMLHFMARSEINMAHVATRGGLEQLNGIIAGHVHASFLNASDVVEQMSSGNIKVLAVTSAERVPQLPTVPTMIEAGYKDFVMVIWNGLAAPVGTPKPVIDRMAGAIGKVMKEPDILKKFSALTATPIGNTAEEFDAQIRSDIKLWGGVVRSAGLDSLAN